jgi:hypothetical protein
MRLGAPHEGHVDLVARMVATCPEGPTLVLVGSSDTTGRTDVPLPWEERRDILVALARARDVSVRALRFAPLPEIPSDGFTRAWFEHVLGACRAAIGCEPRHHFFGADYAVACYEVLQAMRPGVVLHRVPRALEKSGTELRRAIGRREEALLDKYAFEIAHYPPSARERIARISGAP